MVLNDKFRGLKVMFSDNSRMIEGTVKFFKDDRGFGFIETEKQDYFVHFKDIVCDGFKSLKAGQRVKFVPEASPKGHSAKSVEIV